MDLMALPEIEWQNEVVTKGAGFAEDSPELDILLQGFYFSWEGFDCKNNSNLKIKDRFSLWTSKTEST